MNRAKYTQIIIILIIVIALALSACGRSPSRCYLCRGIPHDEPCIVSLTTGDIAVLSAGSYGHAELIVTGGISVIAENGESCKATLPTSGGDMNPDLFCDNCRSLIEATPNDGYVLANLHDLENVQLYPIECITIRDYILTVSVADNDYEVQMVTS